MRQFHFPLSIDWFSFFPIFFCVWIQMLLSGFFLSLFRNLSKSFGIFTLHLNELSTNAIFLIFYRLQWSFKSSHKMYDFNSLLLHSIPSFVCCVCNLSILFFCYFRLQFDRLGRRTCCWTHNFSWIIFPIYTFSVILAIDLVLWVWIFGSFVPSLIV